MLGGVLAGLDLGLRQLGLAPLVESSLLVVALLALTGGLHADGLMDTCDAVFAHATPEHRLEIMRDPRVGSFGVIGFASVLLLKVASLTALPAGPGRTEALVLAPLLGRWSILIVAASFPYGRPAGLGAPVKAAAGRRLLLIASALPLGIAAGVGPAGIGLLLLALVGALLLGWWLSRLLPGLTGDCYGATCEWVEMLVLLGAGPLLATAAPA